MDSRSSAGGRRDRPWLPGLAVALAFLVVGFATLDDYGTTWDENESFRAGLQNLEIVRTLASGGTDFEWPWHELRGYQFAFDTARAAFARLAGPLVGGALFRAPDLPPVPVRGFHLFHLLLTAATLVLVYRIALEVGGSVRVGVLSAAVLATTPKLVAHAQNNPKDVVGLFVFALALWAVSRATRSAGDGGGATPFAWAGGALGLALSSHVLSVLLVPMAGLWVLSRHPGSRRRRVADLAILFGVAGAVAFLLWPWLWPEPLIRTARVVRRAATYSVELPILYLGRIYPRADPPWHYTAVSLLAATPVSFTLAAGWGAVTALRDGARTAARSLGVLALLWLLVPFVADLFTGARYDGVRHLLVVLPALALLAGLGLDRIWTLAAPGSRWRGAARAALALAAAAWLWVLADLARYHPYQDAYLNAPVRTALGRPAEEVFEVEYWGSTYKQGAEWLNARAEPGAVVEVPVARWCAAPYLDPDLVLAGPEWPGGPGGGKVAAETGASGPRYLMLMTRKAFYTPRVREVRATQEPVFTVERLGATLLEVYRLPIR